MAPRQRPVALAGVVIPRHLHHRGHQHPQRDLRTRAPRRVGEGSKAADFVGQHRATGNWLIAESKGNHVDTALKQLKATMDKLITNPSFSGELELHIYMNSKQYTRATEFSENGLGGYYVDMDGYLVYKPDEVFIRETVNGLPIRVFEAR